MIITAKDNFMHPKSKKLTHTQIAGIEAMKTVKFLISKGLTDDEIYQLGVCFWNLLRCHTYSDLERIIEEERKHSSNES
jgi:hypothetical protein